MRRARWGVRGTAGAWWAVSRDQRDDTRDQRDDTRDQRDDTRDWMDVGPLNPAARVSSAQTPVPSVGSHVPSRWSRGSPAFSPLDAVLARATTASRGLNAEG